MRAALIAASVGIAALALGACSENPRAMAANAKMCVDFKAAKAPATGEMAGTIDECAKRWAYSLAPGHDNADMVAEAVVAACNVQLSRWNQDTLSQPGGDGQAPSLRNGETTTPLAEHNAFLHDRALLYVVQARAGACAPPPATNGVPDGVG